MRRRALLSGLAALALTPRLRSVSAEVVTPQFSYPIGLPERPLGDGMLIRHGYACENTWFTPGWWHTGEDWYLAAGETGGVGVYAIADGEIVFAGSEYPGLVVIVRHAADLYSMYGHLDYTLAVDRGRVRRGQLLGTVLPRTDGRAPSHLHFEVRTFLTTTEVNGDAPRYSVACGFNCAPGPGYWPIDAPEHPSLMGWRNPTHLIGRRGLGETPPNAANEVVVATSAAPGTTLWSRPDDLTEEASRGELRLTPGARYPLRAIAAGDAASTGTSAAAYQLWYEIEVAPGQTGWVRAAVPATTETGSDGRPSTLRLDFLPVVTSAAPA